MKQTIRAFALGLLCATLILTISLVIDRNSDNKNKETEITNDEMINSLQQEGYIILTEQELEKMKEVENNKPDTVPEQEVIEEEEEESELTTFTLTIEAGMNVNEISELLYEATMIENQNDFITYLEENEYSTKIQIGEFSINSSMTKEEIANTITNQ
ncbi:hypothetical protein [Aquibacillus rhizosphaerae]|uniref:Endolytic transglycosylase MltG n=1 Tax=Aquibacillus rhizosphaerae TaxID=3051431 RepID=A0ABT7L6Q3_9BACI|nr:hypothetical protein [Aquibacillus sp. LR5S19]MDL4841541.1 hypothetical protein [Aquibacillus sp. LR5S19]